MFIELDNTLLLYHIMIKKFSFSYYYFFLGVERLLVSVCLNSDPEPPPFPPGQPQSSLIAPFALFECEMGLFSSQSLEGSKTLVSDRPLF